MKQVSVIGLGQDAGLGDKQIMALVDLLNKVSNTVTNVTV